MSTKKYPNVLYRVIVDTIRENLNLSNNNFYQIFNLIYKDTAQMYTFGCIFDETEERIQKSGLHRLEDFISSDNRLVEIKLPILTPREKIHFDRLIPRIAEKLDDFPMKRDKIENYEKYYKYYPQYFEALL